MSSEFKFNPGFASGMPDLSVQREEFITAFGFDADRAINSGGIHVTTDSFGRNSYEVLSSFGEETQDAIARMLASRDEGEPRDSMENVIRYARPSCMVSPDALIFHISQDPKLEVTPDEGVIFRIQSVKEDGSLVRRNFVNGKEKTALPANSKNYVFEVVTVQREVVLEEDGVEYGAEITAGIRLKTIDFSAVRNVLERLYDAKNEEDRLTDVTARKIIDPYFKIKLIPLGELPIEEDGKMW